MQRAKRQRTSTTTTTEADIADTDFEQYIRTYSYRTLTLTLFRFTTHLVFLVGDLSWYPTKSSAVPLSRLAFADTFGLPAGTMVCSELTCVETSPKLPFRVAIGFPADEAPEQQHGYQDVLEPNGDGDSPPGADGKLATNITPDWGLTVFFNTLAASTSPSLCHWSTASWWSFSLYCCPAARPHLSLSTGQGSVCIGCR